MRRLTLLHRMICIRCTSRRFLKCWLYIPFDLQTRIEAAIIYTTFGRSTSCTSREGICVAGRTHGDDLPKLAGRADCHWRHSVLGRFAL